MVRVLSARKTGSALSGLLAGNFEKMKDAAYEDVEGLTVSLGVIYALLLPVAMTLQNQGFDDGVQVKNYQLMMCTQREFRNYVVEVLSDPDTGDVGQHSPELFDWNVTLGRGRRLNVKDIIEDQSRWKWDDGSPEVLYDCARVPELAAALHATHEHFPKWRTDFWALLYPTTALWSDHLSAMNSFGMCIFMGGLMGSLVLYISLSLSMSREDASGQTLRRWNSVGFPLLALNFMFLLAAVIVMLLANDMYSESQDPFFLRAGRWAAYAKLALLVVMVPVVIVFFVGAFVALMKSWRKKPSKVADSAGEEAPKSGGAAASTVIEVASPRAASSSTEPKEPQPKP